MAGSQDIDSLHQAGRIWSTRFSKRRLRCLQTVRRLSSDLEGVDHTTELGATGLPKLVHAKQNITVIRKVMFQTAGNVGKA